MKIGVLGGTFDPIHIGHLIVAEEARIKLGLSEVIFLPAGNPRLKKNIVIASQQHRLEMIKLAIKSNPHFKISTVEIERTGPSYSAHSLPLLKKELGDSADIYFLIGMDALAELYKWKDPERLLEVCRVVGMTRPGYRDLDWSPIGKVISDASKQIMVLEVPEIGVSSTDIRRRISQGETIRYLVPENVEKYIRQRALYSKQTAVR